MKLVNRKQKKSIRHARLTKKLKINLTYPRLAIYKSNAHLFAQLIDDQKMHTVAASSTLQLKILKTNVESAKQIGADIAAKALKAGIKKVRFDTGGSRYHGQIKALAEAARAGGLEF